MSEEDIAAMQGSWNERFLRMIELERIAIPGVRETLATLRPHFVMRIVTTSRRRHFEAMHRRTGLLEFLTLQSRVRITSEASQLRIRISPQSLAAGYLLADQVSAGSAESRSDRCGTPTANVRHNASRRDRTATLLRPMRKGFIDKTIPAPSDFTAR
ncbi:MAG: hypothetical protein JJU00_13505 [Opitutales bacterium]|nr:hypothetical protein [Opitutales bacterium]